MMVFLEHRTPLNVFHFGGFGVRLFFVLSGYLIIGGIVRNLSTPGASSKMALIKLFFINRAFRILPIYWLTLVAAGLLLVIGATTAVSWRELGWHAAFAGNIYFGQIVGHWSRALSHFWSLAIEEQFYIFIAPLIIIAGRKWYLGLCAALVGAGIIQQLYLITLGEPDIKIVTDSVIGFGTIALGGWLYGLGKTINWKSDLFPLALLFTYITLPVTLALWGHSPRWIEILTIPVAGLLIVAVSYRPNSLAVRILEIKPLAMFGRVSYGFYIYHYWLNSEALYTMTVGVIDVRTAPTFVQAGALFTATLILSVISWILIEKPLLGLRARLKGVNRYDQRNRYLLFGLAERPGSA